MPVKVAKRGNKREVDVEGGCALIGCGLVAVFILLVLAALVKFVFFTDWN